MGIDAMSGASLVRIVVSPATFRLGKRLLIGWIAILLLLDQSASAYDAKIEGACPTERYRIETIEPSALGKLFGQTSRSARLFKDNIHVADLSINWGKLTFTSEDEKFFPEKVFVNGLRFNFSVTPDAKFWTTTRLVKGWFLPEKLDLTSSAAIYYQIDSQRYLEIHVDYLSSIAFEASLQDVLCIVSSQQVKEFKS
jgi:hypothetical protein